MKCSICGKEFSDSVFGIHVTVCKARHEKQPANDIIPPEKLIAGIDPKDAEKFDKDCDKAMKDASECKKLDKLNKIETDFKKEISDFAGIYGVTPEKAGVVLKFIDTKRAELNA
mgnify:CR=1 FL=1